MAASQERGRAPVNPEVWVSLELRVAGKGSVGKLRGAARVENSSRDQKFRSKNVEELGGAQSGCVQ